MHEPDYDILGCDTYIFLYLSVHRPTSGHNGTIKQRLLDEITATLKGKFSVTQMNSMLQEQYLFL